MNAHLIFMGHFVVVLREICKRRVPDLVIVEEKQAANEVIEFCVANKLKYVRVKSFSDILLVTSVYESVELTIVASFGLILRNQYIQKNKYVLNFHPGDIPNCRGRHPLPAAIKNKHEFMGVTAHLITDERIDCGPVCQKVLVPIDYTRDYAYNADKLMNIVPMIVSHVMDDFMTTGNIAGIAIESTGNYYPPLSKEELDDIFNVKCLGSL